MKKLICTMLLAASLFTLPQDSSASTCSGSPPAGGNYCYHLDSPFECVPRLAACVCLNDHLICAYKMCKPNWIEVDDCPFP